MQAGTFVAVGLLVGLLAPALSAGASHGSIACLGAEGPAREVEISYVYICAAEYTYGDPDCQTTASHQGYDEVAAGLSGHQTALLLYAGGYEACTDTADGRSSYESLYTGAYLCEAVNDTCQEVYVTWYEADGPSGSACDVEIWYTTVEGESVRMSLDQAAGDGCMAGGPPNPGWGRVFPDWPPW